MMIACTPETQPQGCLDRDRLADRHYRVNRQNHCGRPRENADSQSIGIVRAARAVFGCVGGDSASRFRMRIRPPSPIKAAGPGPAVPIPVRPWLAAVLVAALAGRADAQSGPIIPDPDPSAGLRVEGPLPS